MEVKQYNQFFRIIDRKYKKSLKMILFSWICIEILVIMFLHSLFIFLIISVPFGAYIMFLLAKYNMIMNRLDDKFIEDFIEDHPEDFQDF